MHTSLVKGHTRKMDRWHNMCWGPSHYNLPASAGNLTHCEGVHSGSSQRSLNQLQLHQTISSALHKDVLGKTLVQLVHLSKPRTLGTLIQQLFCQGRGVDWLSHKHRDQHFFFQVHYIPLLHRAPIQTFAVIKEQLNSSKRAGKPSGFLEFSQKKKKNKTQQQDKTTKPKHLYILFRLRMLAQIRHCYSLEKHIIA